MDDVNAIEHDDCNPKTLGKCYETIADLPLMFYGLALMFVGGGAFMFTLSGSIADDWLVGTVFELLGLVFLFFFGRNYTFFYSVHENGLRISKPFAARRTLFYHEIDFYSHYCERHRIFYETKMTIAAKEESLHPEIIIESFTPFFPRRKRFAKLRRLLRENFARRLDALMLEFGQVAWSGVILRRDGIVVPGKERSGENDMFVGYDRIYAEEIKKNSVFHILYHYGNTVGQIAISTESVNFFPCLILYERLQRKTIGKSKLSEINVQNELSRFSDLSR